MKTSELHRALSSHVATVTPGLPQHLSSVNAIGDAVAQGDLIVEVVNGSPPVGYSLVKKLADIHRQLVPESGVGSHHRLKSLGDVKIYLPKEWGKSGSGLEGPFILFSSPNAIVHEPGHDHPHGTVFIDSPMAVLCTYQRNLDAEQREIRARD